MQTSNTLLRQLKTGNAEVWRRFVELYTPFIQRKLRQASVAPSDVDDLVQEILVVLYKNFSKFEHNGQVGAFRSWLGRTARFRCLRYYDQRRRNCKARSKTASAALGELEDPKARLTHVWNAEHDRAVLKSLLQIASKEFNEQTFLIFRMTAIDGLSVTVVAQKLGLSSNQIYKARFRVKARLEQLAKPFVDGGKSDDAP